MPLFERYTASRGRSAVPTTLPRMRRRRLSLVCCLVFFMSGLIGRALLGALADLAHDDLARIANALALVGLRRAEAADVRGDLADGLLVDAPHDHLRRGGHLELDAVGRI